MAGAGAGTVIGAGFVEGTGFVGAGGGIVAGFGVTEGIGAVFVGGGTGVFSSGGGIGAGFCVTGGAGTGVEAVFVWEGTGVFSVGGSEDPSPIGSVMHSGQTFLKVSPHGKLQSGFPTNLNSKGFGTALSFSSSSHPSFLQRYPHPPPHRWFPRFLSSSDLGSKQRKGLGTSGVTN